MSVVRRRTYTTARFWYWPPWQLTNPLWPLVWRGSDEWGRSTLVIQPPLLGAFIFAFGQGRRINGCPHIGPQHVFVMCDWCMSREFPEDS